MSKNIFKIYGDKTKFWQWDTKQKLIVLDENITKVHLASKGMKDAIPVDIYTLDGKRICNIPDALLEMPYNLMAYACIDGSTIRSTQFCVTRRPNPNGNVVGDNNNENENNHNCEIDADTLDMILKEVLA